jgi:hypothetical protein
VTPRPPSICPACGELLLQYADGYGHLRGWCKAPDPSERFRLEPCPRCGRPLGSDLDGRSFAWCPACGWDETWRLFDPLPVDPRFWEWMPALQHALAHQLLIGYLAARFPGSSEVV